MTNIVVAFSKSDDATNIKNLLVRNGYEVQAVCTSGAKVLNAVDEYNYGIVVCGYKLADMLYSSLRESLNENIEMVLLVSSSKIGEVVDSGISALSMPLKSRDLTNTLDMLIESIDRRKRKRRETPRKRSAEEQQIIDEAKHVLMEKNNLSEYEAHRYIQKTSMDSGNNIVETASMIIRILMS